MTPSTALDGRPIGRPIGAVTIELLSEALPSQTSESVYALTSDLAGSLAGGRRPAVNTRRRFRRS